MDNLHNLLKEINIAVMRLGFRLWYQLL